MYLKKKNTFVEEKDEEASERVDSYQEIFRMIMHIIAPIILATCVYNLVTTIDMYIFYFAQSFLYSVCFGRSLLQHILSH